MIGQAEGGVVGVDTHKYLHVAVAVSRAGVRLGLLTVPTDASGFAQLLAWARTLGRVQRFGIEGTGSYGQGLVSCLRRYDIASSKPVAPTDVIAARAARPTRLTPRTRLARSWPAGPGRPPGGPRHERDDPPGSPGTSP